MKFEELYDSIGQLGVYQVCIVAVVSFSSLFTVESISMIFVGADMPHWCEVPELANYSYELQRLIAIPWTDPNDPTTFEKCEMYQLNYSHYTHEDFLTWNRTNMIPGTVETVTCKQWIYEQSVFVSTIVSRFDLVCGSAYLNQLISTIYMFGVLIGVTSSGAVSDKIGRRKTLLIFMLIRLVGYAIAFPAVHYAMLSIGRFILGVGTSAVFLTTYVLATEMVGPRFRTPVGVGINMAFSVGFVLTAPLAYAVRHDIKYQVASMGGPAVLILLTLLLLPESPRWLAVNGHTSKAKKVLEKICEGNGTALPENFAMEDLQEESSDVEKKTCIELLRSPKLRVRTIIMDFSWFTCSLVYYSLSLNTGSMSGDIFVNTMLSGLVEIPANVICIFLLDWRYLGRRLTLCGTFFIAGLCSFIGVPLTIYNYGTASTAMAMVGKAFVTMSFSVVYVFSTELFPTEVRHVGIGTASMFARIASMIAPFLGAPLIDIWEPLPSVLFGSVATLAGFLGLLLPETLGHPLLDTIDETEQYQWKKTALIKEKNPPKSDPYVAQVSVDDDGSPPPYKNLEFTNSRPCSRAGSSEEEGREAGEGEGAAGKVSGQTQGIQETDLCHQF